MTKYVSLVHLTMLSVLHRSLHPIPECFSHAHTFLFRVLWPHAHRLRYSLSESAHRHRIIIVLRNPVDLAVALWRSIRRLPLEQGLGSLLGGYIGHRDFERKVFWPFIRLNASFIDVAILLLVDASGAGRDRRSCQLP